MPYPIPLNADHIDFERAHVNTKPEDRPDWPLPSFDAQDWAKAFCKLNPSMDEGLMLTWFANALMRGFDEHAARPNGAIENAREAFLSMIADAGDDFQEQPDGDVNDAGRMIDCTTYKLITGHRQFEELCEALGIKRARYDEPLMEAIDRLIQVPDARQTR